jgi:hypothetical protein
MIHYKTEENLPDSITQRWNVIMGKFETSFADMCVFLFNKKGK